MTQKIKNIEKAAERIRQAVKNREKIILYGDSDMDGIASIVVLGEAIKSLGGEVAATAFPDREKDGYGINFKALEFLKDLAPALFITADLGIANVREVEEANRLGFEVIIIDHHLPLEQLPKASIIVDPQQEGDESEFQYLCNAGLIFKVTEELLGKNLSETQQKSLLELVALATISDMVPQVGDNKTFIQKGTRSLVSTVRPGLKAFLDIMGVGNVAENNYFRIIASLNAAESVDFKNTSYELLTSSDEKKCRELAESLIGRLEDKQKKIRDIAEEVERRIAKHPEDTIIFEGDPAWRLVLAGPVCSIIASKYQKPTFIYRKMDKESAGSVRSLKEGENSVDAMNACSDLLMTYGGHPKASGFRLKNENLEKFKTCLTEYFKK